MPVNGTDDKTVAEQTVAESTLTDSRNAAKDSDSSKGDKAYLSPDTLFVLTLVQEFSGNESPSNAYEELLSFASDHPEFEDISKKYTDEIANAYGPFDFSNNVSRSIKRLSADEEKELDEYYRNLYNSGNDITDPKEIVSWARKFNPENGVNPIQRAYQGMAIDSVSSKLSDQDEIEAVMDAINNGTDYMAPKKVNRLAKLIGSFNL